MTMTNPNKPITKQDLSDFYGKILPYMGGMPDVLANKFARGDLYDTNEKIIGKFIDGKPLYQKTIETSSITTDITSLNIDKIASINGIVLDTSNEFFPLGYDDTDNYKASAIIYGTSSATLKLVLHTLVLLKAYITIQYTKTTDSANSFNISSETDYSTDEHIVGTWIDGSYLYQKTINANFAEGNIYNINSNIHIKKLDAYMFFNGYIVANPFYYASNNYWSVFQSSTTGNLEGALGSIRDYIGKPMAITIQYTKSSS